MDDWKAFLKAIKSSPFWHTMRWMPYLMVLQAVLVASDQGIRDSYAVLGWVVVLMAVPYFLIPPMFLVVAGIYATWKQQASFHKTPHLQLPTTISADDEGISNRTSREHTKFFWAALHQTIETQTHFFVLNTPNTGLIIPKRAFDSPMQCAEFGAFIQRKWAQHYPDAAPITLAK